MNIDFKDIHNIPKNAIFFPSLYYYKHKSEIDDIYFSHTRKSINIHNKYMGDYRFLNFNKYPSVSQVNNINDNTLIACYDGENILNTKRIKKHPRKDPGYLKLEKTLYGSQSVLSRKRTHTYNRFFSGIDYIKNRIIGGDSGDLVDPNTKCFIWGNKYPTRLNNENNITALYMDFLIYVICYYPPKIYFILLHLINTEYYYNNIKAFNEYIIQYYSKQYSVIIDILEYIRKKNIFDLKSNSDDQVEKGIKFWFFNLKIKKNINMMIPMKYSNNILGGFYYGEKSYGGVAYLSAIKNKDSVTIYISFRGTSSAKQIINNFRWSSKKIYALLYKSRKRTSSKLYRVFKKTKYKKTPVSNGVLHKGYALSVLYIIESILMGIEALYNKSQKYTSNINLKILGHSLGGAQAVIFTFFLTMVLNNSIYSFCDKIDPNIILTTFGEAYSFGIENTLAVDYMNQFIKYKINNKILNGNQIKKIKKLKDIEQMQEINTNISINYTRIVSVDQLGNQDWVTTYFGGHYTKKYKYEKFRYVDNYIQLKL
uniref:Fungal lipase-type domain-containing protein n=1 Tax=Megaviridae environmental sample TaxID=1737588 RepID=A0A5J6VJX0_9VIRU|nr:MAG: hypothetical protein [Megaviridae environmental sample]